MDLLGFLVHTPYNSVEGVLIFEHDQFTSEKDCEDIKN